MVNEAEDAKARKEIFDQIQATRPPPERFEEMFERHRNMVYIPAGPFLSGRLRSEGDNASSAEPILEQRHTDGFLIDVFEYPNDPSVMPRIEVTYHQALALCQEQGKRLCTADEWERACKGPRSFVYSYGDTFDPDFCGEGVEEPYTSGSMEQCKSEWNVFDISGNFREWTSTSPRDREGRALVKGGLKSHPEKGTRCALATDESKGFADKSIGFRCCLSE